MDNSDKKNANQFLFNLYSMLENSKNQEVIHWDQNGKSFIITDINKFIEEVLPSNFKHKNYSSFIRQLNMYDFHKIKSDNSSSCFINPLFFQGNEFLPNLE